MPGRIALGRDLARRTGTPHRKLHEFSRAANMLTIEIEREEGGCSIGQVPELPGVIAYEATKGEARHKAAGLALRVIADGIEHGERAPITCH